MQLRKTMNSHKLCIRCFSLIIITIVTFAFSVKACNVPVFRYALERWPADSYSVLVFVGNTVSQEDRATIEWLEKSSEANVPYSNYTVSTVNISEKIPENLAKIRKSIEGKELPCMVVLYPGMMRMDFPVWTGPLSAETAGRLVDSPKRQELAKKILNGDSAVWILLESGDRKKDDEAEQTLKTHIDEAMHLLDLPDQDRSSVDYVPIRETGPDLRVSFSVVRLSRSAPDESMFIRMLMKTEPDLDEYDSYPMAFPVYGRGRVLYALVGDGIEKRNIFEACSFVTGPCSCQIKELNPGVDLLMNVDWESGFDGLVVQELDLPPLVSLSELVSDAAGNTGQKQTAHETNITVSAKDTISNNGSSVHKIADSEKQLSMEDTSENIGNDEAAAEQSLSEAGLSSGSGHLLRNILITLTLLSALTFLVTLGILKPWRRNNP